MNQSFQGIVKSKTMSDNELIAEFMGLVFVNEIDGIKYYDVPKGTFNMHNASMGYFLYHKSWDWLMPVVEKIRKVILPEVRKQIPPNGACKGDLIDVEISCGFMEVSIEIIYRHTVAFIKWYNNSRYNQQKP